MGAAPQYAALVGPGAVPPDGARRWIGVMVVASTVRRRRSRQAVSRPKVVQFSLTEEEFDEVSAAAARSGLARGAFAAEATLAAARGTRSRAWVAVAGGSGGADDGGRAGAAGRDESESGGGAAECDGAAW